MKVFILSVFILFMPVLLVAQEANEDTSTKELLKPFASKVNADRVNLRIGPGIEFYILGQVDKGRSLVVFDEQDGWAKIRWPHEIGVWVYSDYIKESEGKRAIINGNNVNLRLKGGSNYPILTQLMKGDEVFLTGKKQEKWVELEAPDGLTCWISNDFLSGNIELEDFYENEHNKQAQYAYETLSKRYDRFLMGDKNIDLAELKKEFENIAKYYPLTDYAKLGDQRAMDIEARLGSADINSDERAKEVVELKDKTEDIEKEESIMDEKESAKDTDKKNDINQLKVLEGYIQDVGKFKSRRGAFKLVNDQRSICYLKSSKIRLSRYPYQKVEVKGYWHESNEGILPLLEVVDIRWLDE